MANAKDDWQELPQDDWQDTTTGGADDWQDADAPVEDVSGLRKAGIAVNRLTDSMIPFVDEAGAAIDAVNPIGLLYRDKLPSYEEALAARKQRKAEENAQLGEGLATGLEIVGNVASPLNKLIPGKTLTGTAARSAGLGAVYGADAAEPGNRIEGALTGAAIGGAVPVVGRGVSKGLSAVGRSIPGVEPGLVSKIAGEAGELASGQKGSAAAMQAGIEGRAAAKSLVQWADGLPKNVRLKAHVQTEVDAARQLLSAINSTPNVADAGIMISSVLSGNPGILATMAISNPGRYMAIMDRMAPTVQKGMAKVLETARSAAQKSPGAAARLYMEGQKGEAEQP